MAKVIEKTMLVNGERVIISEAVYKAYYQKKEHEDYLNKLAAKHNVPFGFCEERAAFSQNNESVEGFLMRKEANQGLKDALLQLSLSELKLIYELYYLQKTEREVASNYGVFHSVIHRKKVRILNKLKVLINF